MFNYGYTDREYISAFLKVLGFVILVPVGIVLGFAQNFFLGCAILVCYIVITYRLVCRLFTK